jgi:hypothetical protein
MEDEVVLQNSFGVSGRDDVVCTILSMISRMPRTDGACLRKIHLRTAHGAGYFAFQTAYSAMVAAGQSPYQA